MITQKLALMLVAFATTFTMVPALALAHNDESPNIEVSQQEHENFQPNWKIFSLVPRGVIRGVILAKTATGFTLQGKMNSVVTVDASTAIITKIPNQTITLADLAEGDHASVLGVKTGLNVVATKVYIVPTNLHRTQTKGTVTAVTANSVTLQNKKGASVTVQTDTNTAITAKTGVTATMSDIIVGSKVKISGIWDSILNIFTALRIRIK